MKKIDYLSILNQSFQITWKNKFLWVWGFLIAITSGGGSSLNFPANWGNNDGSGEHSDTFSEISGFIGNYWSWIIIAFFFFIALIIILIILGVIARGALIKSIYTIHKQPGEPMNLQKGWGFGKKYFWKILMLHVLIGLVGLFLFSTLFIPVFFLFFLKAYPLGILMAVLAIVIFIPLIVILHYLVRYASFYLVLGDINLRASLESAYRIFMQNFWESILMSAIMMAIGLTVGIGLLTLLLPLLAIFATIGFLGYLATPVITIVVITLGLLLIIPIILFINAILQVFAYSSWVLLFEKIAANPENQAIQVPVPTPQKNLNPEGVSMSEGE